MTLIVDELKFSELFNVNWLSQLFTIIPFEVSIVPTTFIFLAILTPPATVNAPPLEPSDTFVVDPILIPPETNRA